MKKARYSISQVIGILNQATAGAKVAYLCQEHVINDVTFRKCGLDSATWTPCR